MKKLWIYFKLECKRVMKLFPGIFVITLLVLTIAGLILANEYKNKQTSTVETTNASNLKNMKIGVVSNEGDLAFLEIALCLVEETDNIGDICSFIQVSKDEGQKMLDRKELDVLAIFPDNYVENIYYGTEDPIVVRFGSAQSGISSLMFRQLADTLTNYMMETKAAVYTLLDKYEEWGFDLGSDADDLTAEFLKEILIRDKVLNKEIVNSTEGLTSVLYYVCVAIVLITLLWGLSCGSVLGRNSKIMPMLLERQGLSRGKQYITRFGSLFLFFLLNYLVIAIIAIIVTQIMGFNLIPISAYFKIIPILFLACSMTLCIYELTNDGIGGMMFFFFATVILGFLSGFFYPASYFPMWMQNIAGFLPTKIMFDYVANCITETNIGYPLFWIVIYTIIFALIILMPAINESKNRVLITNNRRK